MDKNEIYEMVIQEMVENNRKTLRYSGLRYFLLEAGAMGL